MSMTCLEGQHTVLCSTYGHEGDGAPNNKMRYKDENLGTSTSLLCSDSPVWSALVSSRMVWFDLFIVILLGFR